MSKQIHNILATIEGKNGESYEIGTKTKVNTREKPDEIPDEDYIRMVLKGE